MACDTASYLLLGEAAVKDKTLIYNHVSQNVHLRLVDKVRENLWLLDRIKDDPDLLDMTNELANECLRAIPVLTFYRDAIAGA